MFFFVGISFALTCSMSSGKHHVKNLLPHYKPSLTYNNIYQNLTSDQIVNDGQPMVFVGGASPTISPIHHLCRRNQECHHPLPTCDTNTGTCYNCNHGYDRRWLHKMCRDHSHVCRADGLCVPRGGLIYGISNQLKQLGAVEVA